MTLALHFQRQSMSDSYRRARDAIRFAPQDAIMSMVRDPDFHRGTSQLTVLHIQTLAGSPTCSQNAGEILSGAHCGWPLEAVFTDGAAGQLDASRLDGEDLESLIEAGKLTGAEQFLCGAGRGVPGFGVEDMALYTAAMEFQQAVVANSRAATPFVKALSAIKPILKGQPAAKVEGPLPKSQPELWCDLLTKIISLHCTMDDWVKSLPSVADYGPVRFADSLAERSAELSNLILPHAAAAEVCFDQALGFYNAAVARGTRFAEILLQICDEQQFEWVGCCVTGFQERPFLERLRAADASYISLLPQIELREREPGNLFQSRFQHGLAAAAQQAVQAEIAEVQRLFQEGTRLHQADQPGPAADCLDAAIAHLQKIDGHRPDDVHLLSQHRLEYLYQAGRLDEARQRLNELADAAPGRLSALVFVGLMAAKLSDSQRARATLRKALDNLAEEEDVSQRLAYGQQVANACESLFSPLEVAAVYEGLRPLCREAGNRDLEAAFWNNAGLARLLCGDQETALEAMQEAVALERKIAEEVATPPLGLANALLNRARVRLKAGQIDAAGIDLEEAAAIPGAAQQYRLKLARYRSRWHAARREMAAAVSLATEAAELAQSAPVFPLAAEDDAAWLASVRQM